MPLLAGDSSATTGLAGRILSNWLADARCGFSDPLSDAQRQMLEALAYGLAKAVVDEIQANALVSAQGTDPQGGAVISTGTVS